jgi:hypothetical protein
MIPRLCKAVIKNVFGDFDKKIQKKSWGSVFFFWKNKFLQLQEVN